MKFISLHSVPRSGSTWLQMLFEAHPNVTTKYQPLFSYAFKNQITQESTKEQLEKFINDVSSSNDEFINMKNQYHVDVGNKIPTFDKNEITTLLVKHVRHHQLIKTFLKLKSDSKIICLIRNPCAVVNSVMKNPREYDQKWLGTDEWLTGARKNKNPEDYFGYNKWKETVDHFEQLEKNYPTKVIIVRYEDLLNKPKEELEKLFSFMELNLDSRVLKFFKESHTSSNVNESSTSIYKDKSVQDKWKTELDPKIKEYIKNDIKNTKYEKYY